MSVTWRGLSALLDMGTVGCAAFNSAYFLARLLAGHEPRPRLSALAVLATVSLAVTLEAAALLAMTAESEQPGGLSSFGWWAVRFLTFAGTAGMAALVARRLVGR